MYIDISMLVAKNMYNKLQKVLEVSTALILRLIVYLLWVKKYTCVTSRVHYPSIFREHVVYRSRDNNNYTGQQTCHNIQILKAAGYLNNVKMILLV